MKTLSELEYFKKDIENPIISNISFDACLDDIPLNKIIIQNILSSNNYTVGNIQLDILPYKLKCIEVISDNIIKNYFIDTDNIIISVIYYKKDNNGIIIEYIWKRKNLGHRISFYLLMSYYLTKYKFVDTGKFVSTNIFNLNEYIIRYGIDKKITLISNIGKEIDINDTEYFWNNIEQFYTYSVRIYNKNDNRK